MLHLLIDTSTWLDLAKRRDGQKWIVALRVLIHHGHLELLVPTVVVDEFQRNRPRIEQAMRAGVAERFRLLRQDLATYGSDGDEDARYAIDALAYQVPLIGAMTTRNFDDIGDLLERGRRLEPNEADRAAVVRRGLEKLAPFHRSRNSVADALLVELYASAVRIAGPASDPHAFVSSNTDDFSQVGGDRRQPHPDLASLFGEGSSYRVGVEGLDAWMAAHLDNEEYEELIEESSFQEEPRRLDEILEAEQEFFNRISYQRGVNRALRCKDEADLTNEERSRLDTGAEMLEQVYGEGAAGPYSDFDWGMLNGKLSALRWVLGSAWDFLDT
jgi:PIN domain